MKSENNVPTKLRRTLTLATLTLYGVGTILGAGIYVIISEVAAESGLQLPLSFLVAAIIAAICSLSYAELSSRFPQSAGEAVYVKAAFSSPPLTILIGYSVAFTGLLSASTIVKGFYGYLSLFVNWPEFYCSSLLILIMGLIAIKGVRESVLFVTMITLLEIAGLLIVVSIGLPKIPEFLSQNGQLFFSIPSLSVFSGAFVAFFAFIGFEDMVNMAEETKQPQTTLPLAILLALAISSFFYIGVSLSTVAALSLDDILSTNAPLALLVERNSHLPQEIMGVIGMIAIINGALVQVIMVSRLFYGMAKMGRAPSPLSHVSKKTQTPVKSTLLVVGIIWLLTTFVDLSILARSTSYVILFIFLFVNLALIWIRKKSPNQVADFQVPLFVPILGSILCILLVGLS